MSACISRHGEFGSHTLDDSYTCTLCGVLDEEAMREELVRLRAEVERMRIEVFGEQDAEKIRRVQAERDALPTDERQRQEAADAPLLRIQLVHAVERAERATAERDEAIVAHARTVDGLLADGWERAALGRPELPWALQDEEGYTRLRVHVWPSLDPIPLGCHVYVSTACQHGQHNLCRLVCKYCGNPCQCEDCDHTEPSQEDQ